MAFQVQLVLQDQSDRLDKRDLLVSKAHKDLVATQEVQEHQDPWVLLEISDPLDQPVPQVHPDQAEHKETQEQQDFQELQDKQEILDLMAHRDSKVILDSRAQMVL